VALDKFFKIHTGRFTGLFFVFVLYFLIPFECVNANDSIQVKYKFSKTFFLDIAKSKDNLISVGERGLVFRSSNEGKSWKSIQIIQKPTLTSVAFLNEKTAIVVGHKGGVYRTENLGKNFTKVSLPQLKNEDSLLRVRVFDNNHIVIVGAWGLLVESLDNGKTWKKQQIISPEFDWHLYDVINSSNGLLAVGEAGTLILRNKNGKKWKKIDSPYKGSFFGIVSSKENSFFVYGMRGNIFEIHKSKNNENDDKYIWRNLQTSTKSTWMSGLMLKSKGLLFFGDGGLIGRKTNTFTREIVPMKIVNGGIELNNGSIFLVGLNGGFVLN
jgi:photosystem II stability/assembly factor-like uncharacterized protein